MLQVREMMESDLSQVAEIAKAGFARPWSRQGFAEALLLDNACFLVAVDEGDVLGYSGIYMAADEGEIINIAVSPKVQRRGVGKKLMSELLFEGRKNGICRFFLEVRVSNVAAIHLYESFGFAIQGVRKNFYKEINEDAYLMNRIDSQSE